MRPASGFTWSRPENIVGSERIAVAWTHAGLPGDFAAARSLPKIMAHAPSDDGHVSRYRIGSQSMGEAMTWSKVTPGIFTWAYGFLSAFWRSFTATRMPGSSGAPERRM